ALVRHAMPALIEGTIGPGALFYLVLVLAGFRGALIAALAWSYLAAARRIVRRERLPGLLVLGIVLVSLRTVIAFVTGSAFVYFIQPTAGTFLVALVFLATAMAGRPLIQRLAHDFCPIDPELLARPFLRKFFLRLSLLWCAVLTTNAGCVLWLLLRSSVRSFVLERTVVSLVLTAGGIVVSSLWFIRAMREHGIAVCFSGPPCVVGAIDPAP
ncbi:MAG: VC0807 family protein, partial [Acidimicrobiales bacterium]